MNIDRSEILDLLKRLRYWQEYARKADAHIEVLAEQCEHLQSENYDLESRLHDLESRLP